MIENFQNMTSLFTKEYSTAVTSPLSTFKTMTTKEERFNNSIDYNNLLQKMNNIAAKALAPVTVYLVILMILGLFGNLFVLYAHKNRFRRSSSSTFIVSLAVFDIMTCVFGMSFHILGMVYPYTFVWNGVCKVLSFCLSFTILGSIFILDLIAIDRYRKICLPFRKQLSSRGAKITCLIIALVAAIFSIPMVFIFGSADVDTRMPNITGKECFISAEWKDTDIPLVNEGFHILLFLISVFILAVLYIKVGIMMWKRRNFQGSKSAINGSKPDSVDISMRNLDHDSKICTSASVHFKESSHENSPVQLLNSESPICKTGSSASYSSSKKSKKEEDLRRKHLMTDLPRASGDKSSSERGDGNTKYKYKKQMRLQRITFMLFIITLIFVISFLPFLIISVLSGIDKEFWNKMSMQEIVIMNLLVRTYFINNMVNPIVYWFLDKKFKQEICICFRDVRKCKLSKTLRRDHKATTS